MAFNIFLGFARLATRVFSNVMLQTDIQRHESPPTRGKIFVANHPSGTDPFMVSLLAPETVCVLVTANAFAIPLFGAYIRLAGQIPVLPGKGEQALDEACQLLEQGQSIAVFPEGTYSPQDGGFHDPHTGAARLALRSGAPVVPVGIALKHENSFYISSKIRGRQMSGYWYLYGPYAMTVGRHVYFRGDADDQEQVEAASQKMMSLIRSLAEESRTRIVKPEEVTNQSAPLTSPR